EENDELLLQQILNDTFDTSHPEYNKQFALVTLRRNFNTPVDLCKECLHVKHQEELDQHDGYCVDCDPLPLNSPPPESTPEPDPININQITQMQLQLDQQAQLIQQLQIQVQSLQDTNTQVLQFF